MKVERVQAAIDRTMLFETIGRCEALAPAVRDLACRVLRFMPTEYTPNFHRDGSDLDLLFQMDPNDVNVMATVSIHEEPDGKASLSIYTHRLDPELAASVIVLLHRAPGS